MNNQPEINWTPEMLERFRAEYQRAKDAGDESFMFEGHVFLVRFAFYVIEYLDNKFGTKE